MKKLYILPADKSFDINDATWNVIACYKMFYPPETKVRIGSKRLVPVSQLFPWPPGQPQNIFDIPDAVVRKLVDEVAKTCGLCYDGTINERKLCSHSSDLPAPNKNLKSEPTPPISKAQELF